MISNTIRRTGNIGVFSYQNEARDVSQGGVINVNESLNRSWSGTLTTRTDNNTGVLTLEAGHGIATGNTICIYWTVAGVNGHQRRSTVGTVSVNSVPIDLGVGDNLPIATTPVIVCVEKQFACDTGGKDETAFAMKIGTAAQVGRGRIQFYEADGTTETIGYNLTNGVLEDYDSASVFGNMSGTVGFTDSTICRVSQTYAGAVDFEMGVAFDAG